MANASVDESIEDLRLMLQPDGYDLVVASEEGDEVNLTVVAGAEACEDCLVPKEVFEQIIAQRLTPAGLRLKSLTYPGE